jgi:Dyp-type peroxidase family
MAMSSEQTLSTERSFSAVRTIPDKPLAEPVLNVGEIQGNILAGFDVDYQTLLFLDIATIRGSKKWLRGIAPHITSVGDLLDPREQGDPPDRLPVWFNIAFSFKGLKKLVADAAAFTDVAFKEGLDKRSWLLGDPDETDAAGYCGNWAIGGPGNVPDIVVIAASNDRDRLTQAVAKLESDIGSRLRVLYKQTGARIRGSHGQCEHFGFRDPVSQPGVRGRLPGNAGFLTPRRNPADPHQGLPGQNLIWPGEFVFGYPGQDPANWLKPGAISTAGPRWARDGSLLVLRRLRQDVAAFREYLEQSAAELRRNVPALRGMTPEKLAAKFVGRWPSGTPILLSPEADDPKLANDPSALNHFGYVDRLNGSAGTGENDGTDPRGDVDGLSCPHAAHIRKAYPRDHATRMDTISSMETHRIIRRGIPFGKIHPAAGERGLLFLAYQTSIERQFEFIVRAWLNGPYLRSGGDGYDPIAGQRSHAEAGNRARNFALPFQNGTGVDSVELRLPTDWVTPTGGGYFFVPSIGALRTFGE